MHDKATKLDCILQKRAPLLVAYSGGVDSAFLLAASQQALGSDRVLGVIADSPSLPRQALADALTLARDVIGASVEVVQTGEMEDPNYANNPINRCYFCKAELFTRLDGLAQTRGFAAIAYGENADDMQQVRPGRQAAAEFAVLAPLRDAGLTKAEIRALSRELGLPTADAPAQPCLSSRIPHGTPVTREALAMVEQGEAFVRSLGFRVFRVRHHQLEHAVAPLALVQIAPTEMAAFEAGTHVELRRGLEAVGYAEVEIDPQGYRGVL